MLIFYLLVGRIAAPFPRFDRRSNRRSSLPIHAGLCPARNAGPKSQSNAEVDRISSSFKCPRFMRLYGRAGRNLSRVSAALR